LFHAHPAIAQAAGDDGEHVLVVVQAAVRLRGDEAQFAGGRLGAWRGELVALEPALQLLGADFRGQRNGRQEEENHARNQALMSVPDGVLEGTAGHGTTCL